MDRSTAEEILKILLKSVPRRADTGGVGGDPRRPDDPLPRPPVQRARPAHRGFIVRFVATALCAGILSSAWAVLHAEGGPERGLFLLYAALASMFSLAVLVWAWGRHPV